LSGVLDDIFFGASTIRSYTYSLWLDRYGYNSGHLLLGGIDKIAFIPPLKTLDTTVSNQSFGLWSGPVLTVNTMIGSVRLGDNATELNISLGRTVLSTSPFIWLPPTTAVAIWDVLGVDYRPYVNGVPVPSISQESDLQDRDPIVPCSYLTNNTIIDFQFVGSDIPVFVSLSDLVFQSPYPTPDENDVLQRLCQLKIRALAEGDLTTFGTPILQQLYQVHDHDNKVISIALTDYPSQDKDIVPIPQKGGVAVMDLPTTANVTQPPSGANGGKESFSASSSFGLLVIFVLAALFVF